MGRTWDEFKADLTEFKKGRTWLWILVAILFGLAYTIYVEPAFWSVWRGLPLWAAIAVPVGIVAILFAVDIRAAHKRGERYHLRVSHARARTR